VEFLEGGLGKLVNLISFSELRVGHAIAPEGGSVNGLWKVDLRLLCQTHVLIEGGLLLLLNLLRGIWGITRGKMPNRVKKCQKADLFIKEQRVPNSVRKNLHGLGNVVPEHTSSVDDALARVDTDEVSTKLRDIGRDLVSIAILGALHDTGHRRRRRRRRVELIEYDVRNFQMKNFKKKMEKIEP